jgi:ATP-dependent RNA helicase DeaD
MTTQDIDRESDNSFAQFMLPPTLTTALLRMKYNNPTPIQAAAIPMALQGRDILGSARTGTGKTAAFAIPVIARLMTEPQSAALIMSPTRELAAQILATVTQLLDDRNNPIRTALLIGGESMGRQFDQLRGRPRIIIGTPGRINDHLRRNPAMFKTTNLLVLDEADRMLDMGFAPQINEILKTMPKARQTLMFSATFADSIVKFAQAYLIKPERISVDPVSVSAVNIKHETVQTTDSAKYTDFVAELTRREGSIIVFVRTKHGADRLAKKLERENHAAGVIHGGLRQNQRDRAILAFRNKKTRIMVATDVAARGLDVPHVRHVINYDLPQCTEDYIHRVGRTARAGAEGSAVCMILPSDRSKWNDIERMLNGTKAARPQQSRSNGGGQRQEHGNNGNGNGENRSRNYANASARKKDDGNRYGRKNDAPDDRGGKKKNGGGRPFRFKEHSRKPGRSQDRGWTGGDNRTRSAA